MNTTYKKADSSIPPYISTLANPMRRVHNDNILATESSVMSTTTSDPNYPNFKIKAFNSRRSSTMLGRRTLLWSTSSLERALSWVTKNPMMNFFRSQMCLHRVWERHQNGSCRLCRFPWRTFWLVSWIQHHLLSGDPLLDTLHYLQERSCKDNLKILVVKQKLTQFQRNRKIGLW